MSAGSMLKARKLISGLSYEKMQIMSRDALKIKTSDDIIAFLAENSIYDGNA